MSTTHTPHADVHEHGLADGCDRCGEHAQKPLLNLDNSVLRDLIERVIDEDGHRSENERVAMVHVKRALDEATAIVELDPLRFSNYALRTRGVKVVVMA
jgi:hypothetical protein